MRQQAPPASSEARGGAFLDVAALLLLALAFRAFFLFAMPRVLDTADAVHYIETANHLAAGDFLAVNPKIPVLYPALGALVRRLADDMEWACRLVSFAASVLVLVPLYLLARGMHGRGPAQLAGVIVALWPWLADYGCRVSTEATAALWWVAGAWLVARAAQRGGLWCWLAPWPMLALHLTRPEGLFIALAAPPAALLLLSAGERKAGVVRMLPYTGVLLPGVLLAAVYTRALTGAVTANYRVGFILEEFDFLRFADTAMKTVHEVFPIMLGPVLFLFLGAGLFMRNGKRDTRLELYVLALAAAQWFVSLFVLSPAPRYLMAPLMVLALWSARGMVLVAREAAPLPHGRWLRTLPALAVVGAMLLSAAATLAAEHVGRRPREPREYKTAGLWMREHLEPGLVFTRKPQVAYYAGMPSTGPALEDTLEQAVERARNANARYFVVDERYAPPGLRPLLDPGAAPAGLRVLQVFDGVPEGRVVVYALE